MSDFNDVSTPTAPPSLPDDGRVILSTSTGLTLASLDIDLYYLGSLPDAINDLIDHVATVAGTVWVHVPLELGLPHDSPETSILRMRSHVTLDFLNNIMTLTSNSTLIEVRDCIGASIKNLVVDVFERKDTSQGTLHSWVFWCFEGDYIACYDPIYLPCKEACGLGPTEDYEACERACAKDAAAKCRVESPRCESADIACCTDPSTWKGGTKSCSGNDGTSYAGGTPCPDRPDQCYQTRPVFLLSSKAGQDLLFNTFSNITTYTAQHCVFYNHYYEVIRLENEGGDISGNTFHRIWCNGMGTGVMVIHRDSESVTSVNSFDDCYFYMHVTMVEFSIPDNATQARIDFNLFHHVKGHSNPHITRHGIRNIVGWGNHFDKSWIWDFGNSYNVPCSEFDPAESECISTSNCQGRADWTVLGSDESDGTRPLTEDTYINADFIYSLCDSGRGTFIFPAPTYCNLSTCGCTCEYIDQSTAPPQGEWSCPT